jgi:hypothetical protein
MLAAAKLFLSKFAWQIGAVSAGALLLAASGFLIAAQLDNNRIAELNRTLDDRISNPVTGYVVKLAQAQTNVETVKQGLQRQVDGLKTKADADRKILAATEKKLAAAQIETAKARKLSAALLAEKPKGDTLEERVLDVDAKVLEMLK